MPRLSGGRQKTEHASEPSGLHLHRLLVEVPHYIDYVIATLEGN